MSVHQTPPHPPAPRRARPLLALPFVHYGSALISVVVATLARLLLTSFVGPSGVPFITYFPAVVFSAWIGGLGPALFSLVLGAMLATYLFMLPSLSLTASNPADVWSVGTFLFVGFCIAAIGETQRRTHTRAQASQELLETTLRSIGDAVIVTDKQGRITFMNPVAEKMTGWRQEDALDKDLKTVFAIVNEETRQEVESPVTKALREGIIVGLANHTILLGKDGVERPIDDTGAPIRDEAGNILGVVLVFHDISERKQAEDALRESETLYRTLGEAVPNFIWACKVDGQALFANQRWSEYTGITLGQDDAVPPNVLHHPDDYANLTEIWKAALAKKESYEAEFRLRRQDGVYRWFMARAVPILDEQGEVAQWIGTSTDIHERKLAEEEARRANEMLNKALESALMAVGALDLEGRFTLVNQRLTQMLGYSEAELLGQHFAMLLPPDALPLVAEQFYRTVEEGIPLPRAETLIIRKDGVQIAIAFGWSPLMEDGKIIGLVGTGEDITERKRLEDQLLQAQKLESVGRLAGGIAHDFNNLLTAILGYTELASEECELDENGARYLANVRQAAEKAADLTRQMLAFARRQVIEPRVVNINDLILRLDTMLRRLITENIELMILPEERLHAVKVDPGQFEQILVNLVVNARDALPQGGKITIETHNAVLDEDYARHHEGVTPGPYVMLVVSDTGTGIDEAIKLHIFEPFFTTKDRGRGTGLGLATVYGIVKQAGGHIWLYSEAGEGTTFKIYLPRTTEAPEAVTTEQKRGDPPRGSEIILLVEDEVSVRTLAVWALRGHGYTVLEAADGEEALQVAEGRETEIALLLTDVVMPKMSGNELAQRLLALNPKLKVLYASGYTENTIVHHGVLQAGVAFLQKPFTPTTLAHKVREALAG